MLAGIIGAPNKGKSTLFSALTLADVQIADYPFTTIKPNVGTAYITKRCVDKELGVRCNPQNSGCVDGIRMIPVKLIDVAGLVEGAHEGKGMGNQFLNDVSAADALIIVVDASGRTDTNGNPCTGCDPSKDVKMVTGETSAWLASIIGRHMPSLSRSKNGLASLEEALAGLKISAAQIGGALARCGLSATKISWSGEDVNRFSIALMSTSKPVLIVANKADLPESAAKTEALKREFGDKNVVACSAAIELALRKAAKQGLVRYGPDERSVKILKDGIPREQASALEYMAKFVAEGGTGAQQVINRAYLEILDNIVVYPVEDETSYTDRSGNVLPDARLIKRGSTALDLARSIHTDIAKGMLYAIDAKTKMRLAKDYVLRDNDVIKIVSSAKQK